MYARFTDWAHQAMQRAQEEARRLNHPFIGTEHLLLALTRVDDELLLRIFNHFHLDPKRLRQEVEERIGTGSEAVPPEQLPLTPGTQKALAHTYEEVTDSGAIGPEHLLLGLLRASEGVAALVLKNAGVQIQAVRLLIGYLPLEIVLEVYLDMLVTCGARSERTSAFVERLGSHPIVVKLAKWVENNARS